MPVHCAFPHLGDGGGRVCDNFWFIKTFLSALIFLNYAAELFIVLLSFIELFLLLLRCYSLS